MSKSSDINIGCNGLFASLLTVLFIGLKLTGYVTWSWWMVLAPMWISAIIGTLVLGILVAVYLWVER